MNYPTELVKAEHRKHMPVGRLTLYRLRFAPTRNGRQWLNDFDENVIASVKRAGDHECDITFRNDKTGVEYTLHDIHTDDRRYTLTANGHVVTSMFSPRDHACAYGGTIDLDPQSSRLTDLLVANGFHIHPYDDCEQRRRLTRPIPGGHVTALIRRYLDSEYATLTVERGSQHDGYTLDMNADTGERLTALLHRLDATKED